MTDLIQRLVDAFIRQEGQPPDSTNPGDIRDPVWLPGLPPLIHNGAVASRRKYWSPDDSPVAYRMQGAGYAFWVPRTRLEGEAGLAHIIMLHIAEGDSLMQLIGGSTHYPGFAPAGDGNIPLVYAQHVAEWAKIPDSKAPLWSYL